MINGFEADDYENYMLWRNAPHNRYMQVIADLQYQMFRSLWEGRTPKGVSAEILAVNIRNVFAFLLEAPDSPARDQWEPHGRRLAMQGAITLLRAAVEALPELQPLSTDASDV